MLKGWVCVICLALASCSHLLLHGPVDLNGQNLLKMRQSANDEIALRRLYIYPVLCQL